MKKTFLKLSLLIVAASSPIIQTRDQNNEQELLKFEAPHKCYEKESRNLPFSWYCNLFTRNDGYELVEMKQRQEELEQKLKNAEERNQRLSEEQEKTNRLVTKLRQQREHKTNSSWSQDYIIPTAIFAGKVILCLIIQDLYQKIRNRIGKYNIDDMTPLERLWDKLQTNPDLKKPL